MDISQTIFVLLGLLIFSAYFSATETAFSSVNRVRLKHAESRGNKRAKVALYITDNFDRALSTILVGNNIVNIAATAIATNLAVEINKEHGTLISTIFMTIIVLAFGEILPKSFAKENSEKLALLVSYSLRFFMFILMPIVLLFIWLKKGINILLHVQEKKSLFTISELKFWLKMIRDEGQMKASDVELINNALSFNEITVREILTPRINITGIEINTPNKEISQVLFTSHLSRFPVFEHDIDNVIGVLHIRDWFEAIEKNKSLNIHSLLNPCLYVHRSMKISALLNLFKKKRQHLAIVTDDYGGTLGIVTLEDVLEELVGDIWDEADEVHQNIFSISERVFEASGEINLRDFFSTIKYIPSNFSSHSSTLGGYVMESFGHLPEENEEIKIENLTLKILKRDENRIAKVLVTISNN